MENEGKEEERKRMAEALPFEEKKRFAESVKKAWEL